MKTIRFHGLRLPFASQRVIQHTPIRAVQEPLGHSEFQITLRYAHLAPSALHAAVGVLEAGPAPFLPHFEKKEERNGAA